MAIDLNMTSWVNVRADSDFPIQNLPFGVGTFPTGKTGVCSIIGDQVIDLAALYQMDLLPIQKLTAASLEASSLNAFIALGKPTTSAVRLALAELLREETGAQAREKISKALHDVRAVTMHLPVDIGDYTDFYSSREHATNVGSMFRDPDNALLPNWLHIPVGYHGRASSIVISGTPIKRPQGQTKPADSDTPVFGPTRLLDFELEMGFVVGKDNALGEPVPVDHAEEHIFGLTLFNDWSARDIQKWEYVPLGPFLAKSFASTMSPWIVTLEALEPFRTAGPKQEPQVLPYLQHKGDKNYDIELEVAIMTASGHEKTVCRSNFKYMYWNMCQQLAHHTINGCNLRIGDVCASGTISGPDKSSFGSMLELTWRGTQPIEMPDGTERKFIEDGDTVILRGFGRRDNLRIGFGEAIGKVVGI